MSTRTTLIVSIALIAIAALLSLAVFNRLPDPMASHWGFNDQVNGTVSRFWGAFLMPIISLAMLGLFILLPGIDPLKANIAKFREVFNAFIAVIIAFLLYIHVLTIVWNLGFQGFRMSTAVIPGIGLLFVFAGLLMRRAKRNFFIGIRTPWTLSNDEVWDRTHRLGGTLFKIAAVVIMLLTLVPAVAVYALLVLILGVAVWLTIYSYLIYRKLGLPDEIKDKK